MSDRFLAKYPQFISDINAELRCKLCKRVMSNASMTPCGCKFCYYCIVNHLKNNDCCPVGNTKCNSEIQINDITFDNEVNNTINKLIVKCTNRNCDYEDELVKVVHHFETCGSIKSNNLTDLNCEFTEMKEEGLSDNLENNENKDYSILVKSNEDLKTRVSQLEVEKVHLDNENKDLKKRISKCDQKNDKLQEDSEYLRQKYRELQTRMENLEGRSGKQNGQLELEIEDIKSNYEEMKGKNKEFQSRLANLELIRRKNWELQTGSMRVSSRMSSFPREHIQIKEDNEVKNRSPYTWTISGVSEKMKSIEIIWSPSFYFATNGYRMQAGIRLGSEVSFFGRILKSENDDELIWPCKKSLSIKLFNQLNRSTFKKVEIKFDNTSNHRPRKDENGMQRWDARLTTAILKNESVIQNDTILLSCIIDK